MRKTLIAALGMLLLVTSNLNTGSDAYAIDCTISFDLNCLSKDYNAEEVEATQQQTEERLQEFQQAKEELAEPEAQEESARIAEEIKEQRHQEQIEAQRRIEDAIRDIEVSPTVNVDVHVDR